MNIVGSIFILISFLLFCKLFRLVNNSRKVINIVNIATNLMRDATIGDNEKESAMQAYSIQLISLFMFITAGSMAALGLPFLAIYILDKTNLLSFDGVLNMLLSVQFILVSSIIMLLAWWKLMKK